MISAVEARELTKQSVLLRKVGKNIKKFIKWFNKGQDRETDPYREFKEELVDGCEIDEGLFQKPSFHFVKTKYRGIQLSFYKVDELCRFDIYELVLNKEQEKFFETIKNKNLKLFTREEIESSGIDKKNDKRIIGDQTVYILED